jgi:hypothetical protein
MPANHVLFVLFLIYLLLSIVIAYGERRYEVLSERVLVLACLVLLQVSSYILFRYYVDGI